MREISELEGSKMRKFRVGNQQRNHQKSPAQWGGGTRCKNKRDQDQVITDDQAKGTSQLGVREGPMFVRGNVLVEVEERRGNVFSIDQGEFCSEREKREGGVCLIGPRCAQRYSSYGT